MLGRALDRVVGVVTERSKLTIVVMIVLTAAVGAGATSLAPPAQEELGSNTTEQRTLEYIQENYGTGQEDVTSSRVYVRDPGGNVLSKASLLESLRFQRNVTEDEAVADLLADRPVIGVAPLVARQLAGDPDADIDAGIEALERANRSAVEATVERVLAPGSETTQLLPANYTPGTATAEARWMTFRLVEPDDDGGSGPGPVFEAETAILDHIDTTERGAEYFTFSGPANQELNAKAQTDTLELIGPIALLLILVTLAFAYRDILDVVVGMLGVVLTLVWLFGIIGWLNVPFGSAAIIAPILMIGLSIDYGIHVFMRYREERGPGEGIRPSMRRALAGVGVALVLVTVTTAIGFLSNLTNDLAEIRSLAIGTSVGVTAALIVFVTLVPALKVELDGLVERFGRDRRRTALGTGGGRVGRFLTGGARLARISAVGVLVVALVAGAGGAAAWTELDKEISSQPEQPAQWKQELPEPFAVQEYPFFDRLEYVQSAFQRSGPDFDPAQVLVEGDVTDPETLERIDAASTTLTESEVVFRREDGSVPMGTPVTVIRAVAAQNASFNATLAANDPDGDGIPDTEENVTAVYDALFDAAPEQAATVIERSGGEYRSVRLLVPTRGDADFAEVTSAVRDAAATIEGDDTTATATGLSVVISVQVEILTNNILLTLVVSLVAIFLLLMAVYRLVEGSATLGAVTVLPIALVVAWVFGAMFLLSVPLTLFTALMLSLAIGLGVDYAIHISERFAQELPGASDPEVALERAVRGTGGALLGSTATTVGAFATLTLSTFPQVRQLGTMVALALVFSFVAAVFVLPSLLVLWARRVEVATLDLGDASPADDDR